MTDYGARYTDRREAALDKRLQRVYADAQKDLQKKLADFVEKKEKQDKQKQAKLAAGEISEQDYKRWLAGKVFQEKQWKEKVDEATDVLLQSNRKAMTLIRGEQLNVFTENANWQAYDAEKATGFSFTLYDTATTDRLLKAEPELLPRKTVNGKKDKAWNKRIISNVVTQGIIQGESIPKIAKRMAADTSSTNMKAMVRYARTALTGAQNAGRMETMHRAEDMGIRVKKQWLATLDARTRDSHRHLDGDVKDIDEPFRSDFGKIMFPGDPAAHPGDVYNCRCTMVYVYPDFADEGAMRRNQETGGEIEDISYDEWKAGKTKGEEKKETFVIQQRVRESVTRDEASEDWFEYEKANVMAEYIRTGKMPRKDMYQHEIGNEERQRLAAEAELIQSEGEKTKTKYKTLYRGMVMDQDEVREMFTPGQMVELDTITAATPDKKIASIYMDVDNAGGEGVPVIIEIQKPDGIYGFVRDDLETVLPKGSQFRCEKNWMDQDGVVHISLYAKKGPFRPPKKK